MRCRAWLAIGFNCDSRRLRWRKPNHASRSCHADARADNQNRRPSRFTSYTGRLALRVVVHHNQSGYRGHHGRLDLRRQHRLGTAGPGEV